MPGRVRADPVAALDLVRVGDLLTGELGRVRAKSERLVAEPAVLERRQQLVALRDELGGVGERLGVGLLLQLRRPVVGVDQPVHVPPQPEPEQDICLARSHRSNSAAWPWPTPTHRVASP